MEYQSYIIAKFEKREKRFTAYCTLPDGKEVTAHVRNTGRCAELFIKGVEVALEYTPSKTRKNDYTLYMVNRDGIWINIDSQAPNKLGIEGIQSGLIQLPNFKGPFDEVLPEKTFGKSRFDLLLKKASQCAYVEFKGVTLEKDGIVYFPDAPSERAEKHVDELIEAKKQGNEAFLIFIIQLGKNIRCFQPNVETQPSLQKHMIEAKKEGVKILAYKTVINQSEILIDGEVPVNLEG